jgi:dTDP-4-amino-4,6-dideoxygalactose transaminase
MAVPFLDLASSYREISAELDEAYRRVMQSGWYVLGPEVEAFESEYAEYCGTAHCLGISNGLEALHLLLRAYDVGVGDEVIVPSNTFIATWLAVTYTGATPVAAEPDSGTYNLDVDQVLHKITPNTKAIIPVHLYGQTADMDAINALAARHGLVVIEDAAQSQGARYKGRASGGLGHAGATSFYPGKNLGAFGDAGAITTDDSILADRVKSLRNYGSTVKYEHDQIGYNARLDELQAALLRVKLRHLDSWNARRKRIAAMYNAQLAGLPLILPYVESWAEPAWHLYVVRCPNRDRVRASLMEMGVQTLVHYPKPAHLQPCYAGYAAIDLEATEKAAGELLSLPISPFMTEAHVDEVVSALRRVVG